ncbi:MAG TPA: TonB family protein [Opitutus sp.]|nr:TonB family protein [Opitutus sp.]
MINDADLLRRYVRDHAEDAFRELVERHLNFVYSAALRQVNGDTHLARDVTQLVFVDLARKAGSLAGRRVLAGWLFVSTRYAAAKLVRQERRRQIREQEAFIMNDHVDNREASCDWSQVRPLLDDALAELSEADREAILLRFFEGRPFAEVGARLRLTENTARMRVERALDKLRLRLMRSGVNSTTAGLAIALANQGVLAAPAGLAPIVSGLALAGAGAGGTAGVVMTFMSMSKLQLGILGAVAATGTTAFVLQTETQTALAQEISALQQENRATAVATTPTAPLTVSPNNGDRERSYDAGLAQLAKEAAALQRQQNAANARATSVPKANVQPADTLNANHLDRFPRPIARVAPEYPKELREAGVSGEVLVEFVVDKTGAVQGAVPVSSTHPGFEAAAVAAVEKWKFDSGLKGGRAVNTRLQQTITFSLSRDEKLRTSDWF